MGVNRCIVFVFFCGVCLYGPFLLCCLFIRRDKINRPNYIFWKNHCNQTKLTAFVDVSLVGFPAIYRRAVLGVV